MKRNLVIGFSITLVCLLIGLNIILLIINNKHDKVISSRRTNITLPNGDILNAIADKNVSSSNGVMFIDVSEFEALTPVVDTDLESDDMTFVGTSIAGVSQQTDYSDIKNGIIGNPGNLGGVVPVNGSSFKSYIMFQRNETLGGGYYIDSTMQSSGVLSGTSVTIDTNIPQGSMIIASQFRVDSDVSDDDGDDTWNAAYTGGSSQVIGTNIQPSKNTKYNKMYDSYSSSPIMTDSTDIELTPNGTNFTGGAITVVTYFIDYYGDLNDAP